MDPAKMKVVDLRSELGALGLDTKGNKPALVERLRKALEAKTGKNFPDTSILDTSTEDADEVATPRKPGLRTTRRSSSSRLTGSTPAKVARQEPPEVIPEKEEKEASPPPKESPPQVKPIVKSPEPEEPPQPETMDQDDNSQSSPPSKEEDSEPAESMDVDQKQEPSIDDHKGDGDDENDESAKKKQVENEDKRDDNRKQEDREDKDRRDDDREDKGRRDYDREDKVRRNDDREDKGRRDDDREDKVRRDDDREDKGRRDDDREDKGRRNVDREDKGRRNDDREDKGRRDDDRGDKGRRDDDRGDKDRDEDREDSDRRDEDRRDERREMELTEEEEWDLLNEKLIVKEKERIEREKKQEEEDAKRFEELSEDPIKLQRLKRKFERKARWSNYYRTIEATNDILTPPVEPVPMLQKKEVEEPEKPVEPELNDNKVTLSWYDSDLNQYMDLPELNSVVALSEGAFAYAWAGVRATHGVQDQRVCFEVRVGSVVTTNEVADKETMPINGLRIGWSTDDSNLHLGDGEFSYGYESTGRSFNAGEFKEYGKTFTEKDIIGAYVDLQSNPCKIFYTLNGVELGNAFEFDKEKLGGRALYPHVLTKNMCYKINMGYERYNLLTRTKIVRKRIEIPIAEVLEERRKKEEEIKKKKEEQIKKRQERQKKRREEREKTEREKKEKEASEKKNEGEKTDVAMETDADGKEMEEDKKEETKDESMENGEKTEEAPVEVKTEPKDDAKDGESKEEPGEAEEISEEQALAGGTLDKRVKFVFRHTVEEELDGAEACLVPGYVLLAQADLVEGPRRPNSIAECEVILMVGMPGSGKTYWARKHCEENPDKRYNILSTGTLFDKMKVDCKPFRTSYEGRWDAMVSKCAKCVLKLLEMAKGRRRNFILDQTNVYPSAQRRKLREFEGYRRVAVVIVPEASVLAERQASRETTDGKEVPDPAVIDMKANFTLPEKGTFVDDVIYAELDEEGAKKVIEEYLKEAKAAGVVKEREKRERSAARETQSARPRSDDRRRDRDDKRRDGGRDRADRWSSGGSRWGPGAGMGGGPPGGMGGRGGGRWGPPGGGPRDRNWPQPRNDFGREREFRGRGPGGPPGPMGGMGHMGPGGPRQDRGPRGPMDRGFGRDRSQNNRPPPNQQDKRPGPGGPGGPGALVGPAGPPGPGPVGASNSGPSGSWQRGSAPNQRGTNRPAQSRPNPNNQNQKDSGNNQMANQNQSQNQQAWNQWSGAWGGWGGGNWGNQNQGWGNWGNWGWGNNQPNNAGGQQGNAGKGSGQNNAQGQNSQWGGYTAQQWYQWQQWQQQQQGWPGQYNTGGQTGSGGNQQGASAADQAQAWAQYYQNYGAGNAAGNNTNATGAIDNKK
ncbi:heterogeneous nuclear ribonucleoprotein U-like protein 1 isoform X1 [Pieris brassicae]|uniref:SAP domain-containing protein n=1 Tax=Pieris brassicae TaxID=7116 RepID=A0A9P0XJN0_PIEBR|nr:heterogeneous nuclear ribonucleoprotein U-like protein 1 isoform X1 [Pieris brassicae]CAH4037482.1 unnamed protein product [Pieris brassicae]